MPQTQPEQPKCSQTGRLGCCSTPPDPNAPGAVQCKLCIVCFSESFFEDIGEQQDGFVKASAVAAKKKIVLLRPESDIERSMWYEFELNRAWCELLNSENLIRPAAGQGVPHRYPKDGTSASPDLAAGERRGKSYLRGYNVAMLHVRAHSIACLPVSHAQCACPHRRVHCHRRQQSLIRCCTARRRTRSRS